MQVTRRIEPCILLSGGLSKCCCGCDSLEAGSKSSATTLGLQDSKVDCFCNGSAIRSHVRTIVLALYTLTSASKDARKGRSIMVSAGTPRNVAIACDKISVKTVKQLSPINRLSP